MATAAPPKLNKLRTESLAAGPLGVDRENKRINGFVVAEEGVFKDRRGEFDRKSLRGIVSLMKLRPNGLKSHFTHPSLSADGLSRILGRAKNPRLTTGVVQRVPGEYTEVAMVRADLEFNEVATKPPVDGGTPLAEYVMDLAESDPDLFGSSLVLQVDEEFRRKSDGTLETDESGHTLPALWRPTALNSIDIVSDGDAVTAFLSDNSLWDERLTDDLIRQVSPFLQRFLGEKPREVVETQVMSFLKRELDRHYGTVPPCDDEDDDDVTGDVELKQTGPDPDDLRRELSLRYRTHEWLKNAFSTTPAK